MSLENNLHSFLREKLEDDLMSSKPASDATTPTSRDGNESAGLSSGISQSFDESKLLITKPISEKTEESNSNVSAEAFKKRACAFAELIATEKLYIKDLSEIVKGYMGEMRNKSSDIPIPEDLKAGKLRLVFGNIEAIYEWHESCFLYALQRCEKAPASLGPMIKGYERKFIMYFEYCQNKPVSEHIVSEHYLYFDRIRQKLGHRLDLSDLLIKPVQRITKYELLLKELAKQTERLGQVDELEGIKESCSVMQVICRTMNDTMITRRLQKFEGKITDQGKLLLNGPLMCIEDINSGDRNPSGALQRQRELQVFLFERSIIFADISGKKTQFSSPSFIYRSHMLVNKMQLEELPNNRFLLKSTDPKFRGLICYAPNVEQNREWLDAIRQILQSQFDFEKAIMSPIQHQKELKKD